MSSSIDDMLCRPMNSDDKPWEQREIRTRALEERAQRHLDDLLDRGTSLSYHMIVDGKDLPISSCIIATDERDAIVAAEREVERRRTTSEFVVPHYADGWRIVSSGPITAKWLAVQFSDLDELEDCFQEIAARMRLRSSERSR